MGDGLRLARVSSWKNIPAPAVCLIALKDRAISEYFILEVRYYPMKLTMLFYWKCI